MDARVIDGTGAVPVEHATLVFDGQIRELLTPGHASKHVDAETIDAGGRTVIPGLINAHVHLSLDADAADPLRAIRDEPLATTAIRAAARARRMLSAGITTARDLGGREYIDLIVRDMIKSGEIPGPRMLCAGKIITMTGGHGWPVGREADGPDDVRKAVREQIKAGADVVKFMATGGVLTPGVEPGAAQLTEEEMRAGIIEAHKAGRRTATHAQGNEGIKAALRAGIDTVEHGIYLDDEAIALMKMRGVVFVPTLAAPHQIIRGGRARGIPHHIMDKTERVVEVHTRSFQAAWRAGVIIAAGNDGGTPLNAHQDLVTELRLMVEAGLTPLEAIRAATWGSACALGLQHELGVLAPGKLADLVVLDGDPLEDINALGRIWRVFQHGKLVPTSEPV